MAIQSYSARPSAVRGLARHLGNANTQDVDLAALITRTEDGKFVFDTDEADKAAGLNVSDEDQNFILTCGHANCPSCGVHLSNGLLDFDSLVDTKGSEAEAYKLQKHEWSCMGCGHEWGKEIAAPVKAAKANKTGRTYPNRHKSDVETPSELVFGLADAMTGAKRKEVVDAAIAKGVTPNTARAAYQHWRKARGLSKAV
jgi:hypothetical protein